MLLDQLDQENAVDVFQAVRNLQRQRAAMITSFVSLKKDVSPSFSVRR
jgi:hypothetical protein